MTLKIRRGTNTERMGLTGADRSRSRRTDMDYRYENTIRRRWKHSRWRSCQWLWQRYC